MNDGLPQGWITVRLEELVSEPEDITYGVLKPGEVAVNGVPMIRVMDLVRGQVNDSALYQISRELASQYSRTKLRGGEVLISVQGSVGRVAIVPKHLAGANISRTLAVVPPLIPQLARWIWTMLQTPQVQAQIEQQIGGTTRDSLNLRDLRVIEIPFAPPDEQQRLMAKLEGLMQILDNCQQRLNRVDTLLKLAGKNEKRYKKDQLSRLSASLYSKAFRGELLTQDPNDEPARDFLERIRKSDTRAVGKRGGRKKKDVKQRE